MNLKILRCREVGVISDFLRDLYQPVGAEEFGRHLVEVCMGHLPEFTRTTAYDETRRSDGTYAIHCNRMDELGALSDVVAAHIGDNPAWRYAMAGGEERVLNITDFISQREFRRTALHREAYKPMGCDYQLAVAVHTPTHIGGLTLHRDRPIPESLRPLLAILAPHIERAHSLAQRRGEPGEVLARCHPAALGLTAREAEVLRWVAAGKRDSEIATILAIAPRTVSKHVERLLAKLGAETRTAAVAAALQAIVL